MLNGKTLLPVNLPAAKGDARDLAADDAKKRQEAGTSQHTKRLRVNLPEGSKPCLG